VASYRVIFTFTLRYSSVNYNLSIIPYQFVYHRRINSAPFGGCSSTARLAPPQGIFNMQQPATRWRSKHVSMATRREQCLPTWQAVTRVRLVLTKFSKGKEDKRARSQCYGTARSTDFCRPSWTRLSDWLCKGSCRAQIVVCCPVCIKQDHCHTQHTPTMQSHWLQQDTA